MNKIFKKLSLAIVVLLLSSCATEISYEELSKLADAQNKEEINSVKAGPRSGYQTFYKGSDLDYDYFEVTNFNHSKEYKVTRLTS
jgi:hypothetical protein